MNIFQKSFVGLSLAAALISTSAFADDKSAVQKFYDLLSNPGSTAHVAAFQDVTSDKWESVGNYSGKNKSRKAFVGQMGGFAKLIPDLNWAVQAMHQDGNFVIVRSRAAHSGNMWTPIPIVLGQ